MVTLGILFSLFICLVLPLGMAFFWQKKFGSFRPILLGALTFIIFQMLTRIPLIQTVLPDFAGFTLFMVTRPVLYLLFLSLTAGIFEELGRYIMMKCFMKNSPFSHSIGFGIGHGGIEAILLVGVFILLTLLQQGGSISGVPSSHFFLSGIERLLAMSAHTGLSVMVWESLRSGRRILVVAAVGLHGLMNFSAVYLMQQGVSLYLVEGVVGLFAAGLLLYTYHIYGKTKEENPVEEENH